MLRNATRKGLVDKDEMLEMDKQDGNNKVERCAIVNGQIDSDGSILLNLFAV